MRGFIKTYGPALVSGVLLAIAFPSWRLFPLAWVGLTPLFFFALPRAPRACFGHFFLTGWVFHSITLQWLLANFMWAGGWAFWGHQALSAVMALYWGLFGAFWSWAGRRTDVLPRALTAAVFWMGMEFLQERLFTGFGWTSLGYSQGPNLLAAQLAALGGGPLISGVMVGFAALLAQAAVERRGRARRIVAALALAAGAHGLGFVLLGTPDYETRPLRVGLVQSNFPLEMKWDWEYTEEMVRNAVEKSYVLAQNEQVDLMVWPETLITDTIDSEPIREMLEALTTDMGLYLFTGSQRFDHATGDAFNSSYLMDDSGRLVGHYDKIRLAPFGEYAPLGGYLPFIRRWVPAISDLRPGVESRTFDVRGRAFGPLICFEVVFPHLAERLRGAGADFLVVITNLGWFGETSAMAQEIEIARLRAIETRLPVAHCANTGISGVFDPWGRLTVVNAAMGLSGYYARLGDDLPPYSTTHSRRIGAMRLAAPGRRPAPWPPGLIPMAAVVLSALTGLYALWAGRVRAR